MCGICGFVSGLQKEEKTGLIHRMMAELVHRGPDDAWSHLDENIALGFQRLSIIDLAGGRQPLSNEDDTVWLVFNGEIYNFQQLRAGLKQQGHQFKTNTDTEVIVHAYEEWGEECLARLEGMFAFVIWDSNKKELFAAVDRVGIKPLYYASTTTSFVFASEIKSILSSGLVETEMDHRVLPYHMALLWAPFPLTLFRGIEKLDPGHYLIYRNGRVQKKQYWDLAIDENDDLDFPSWLELIHGSLKQAVHSHMISEVPLGAFLSGGIDSSAICSFMNDFSPEGISTYFIAFSEKDLKNDVFMNEEPYADVMAEKLHSNHRKIIVSPDVKELIHEIVWHLDEPIGDPAAISTYLVAKAARETLTVLLSGVGGDEVFAGYPRYLAMKILQQYNKIPAGIQKMFSGAIEYVPGGKFFFFRNLKKFMKSTRQTESEAYFNMLGYFNKYEQSLLFSPDFFSEISDVDVFSYHRKFFEQTAGLDWLNRLMYLDFKTFLPCLNLMYTDKMSMAASIEVRVPFLDHQFIEAMFKMPARYKLKGKVRKYAFKKSMEKDLPKDVIWRKKSGFAAPIHSWIRGDLKEFTEYYLSESRLKEQGIFNHQYIRGLLDSEYANREYYSNHIWQLLTFQIWYDRFFPVNTY